MVLFFKIQLTTKLALYGCIAYTIDVICSFLFLPSIWKKLKWTKISCCILSWVFSLAFGLLYYVGDCSGIYFIFCLFVLSHSAHSADGPLLSVDVRGLLLRDAGQLQLLE